VLIDWKTPTAIENDAKVAAQLTMEILAFAATTRRRGPVLFVATDLRNRMRVWKLLGLVITEYRGPGGAFMTVSQGFGVVCQQLPTCIAACKQWVDRLERQLYFAEGDDDDGDDLGADDEGTSALQPTAGVGAPAAQTAAIPQPVAHGAGGRTATSARAHRGFDGASSARSAAYGASLSPRSTGSGGPLSPRSTQLYRDIARHKRAERFLALMRRLPRELGIENVSVEF
jgi:hypothetical protein